MFLGGFALVFLCLLVVLTWFLLFFGGFEMVFGCFFYCFLKWILVGLSSVSWWFWNGFWWVFLMFFNGFEMFLGCLF